MHANLKGALEQLNKSYRAFEHKGEAMSKAQVKAVLEYGIDKGYKTTVELTDEEVDTVLADKPIKTKSQSIASDLVDIEILKFKNTNNDK